MRKIGLAAIIFVVSLPLMVNYCIDGKNVSFYLRLLEEGGAENLFFLLPSLLVRAGVPAEVMYKLLLFLSNVGTALIAYFCFGGIFSDKIIGLVGSMVYTWLPYRLNDLYGRGDLGEAFAMMFLPILLFGFIRLFTETDIEKKNYRRLWILLALGYSLLMQAYLLSFLTAAAFTLLLCAVQWKKTFRKPTFFVLLKTVAAFAGLNAWTAVLLLYRFKAAQFPFGVVGNGRIQSRGVYFSNFLQMFFRNGTSNDVAEEGMRQIQPYGLGFVVTFCVLVFLWLCFVGRYQGKTEKKELLKFVKCLTVLGGVLAVMTTNSFPWDVLQNGGRLFHGLIVCLYEPTRLLPFVAVCLTVTVCAVVWQIKQWESKDIGRYFLIAVVVIAFTGTQYLTGDILRTGQPRSLYGVTYGEEGTEAEYQLINLDISPLDYAKYEGSRESVPAVFYAAEAASVAGACALAVLAWRKKDVEKV